MNEDAIFSFNNGTTTLLDIRKGLRTKPRTQNNTLDQNEIFNGTVCIFENKSWSFSKRIEIRKENSDLEISPYIGNNLKCDTKSIEKNCVYYEDEIQKNYQEKVVVEIQPLDNFYEAEEYHQKYLEKNPQGYCHIGKCFFG